MPDDGGITDGQPNRGEERDSRQTGASAGRQPNSQICTRTAGQIIIKIIVIIINK